ncbi:unnamed protein product [Pylaiella littoralis]
MKRRVTGGRGDLSSNEGNSAASSKSPNQLKHLDIYARPKQEFQRATVHGAVVTIVLVGAVLALAWRELTFSMKTEIVQKLFVNSTISPTVNVTFDVVFARIPCALLSIDAEDSLGIPQENLRHDVTRTRLAQDGRPLDSGEKHALGNTLKEVIAEEEAKEEEKQPADAPADGNKDGAGKDVDGDASKEDASKGDEEEECNCYGAGFEGECCRTCEDVRTAYRRKGWRLDASAVPACADQTNQGSAGAKKGALDPLPPPDDEGCRLAGSLEVSRTRGNFHFAPGYQLHRHANAMTFYDRIQVALESFNTTHTINKLTFGDQPPFGHASPKHITASTVLEGHQKTVQDTHAMHQYFLQLVPTVYRLSDGATVHSNQYSATEHLKHVYAGPSQDLPGVYFYYEVSPVQALVEEKERGVLSFLTGACGVVGGVYNILGLVNTGIDGFLRGGGGGGYRSR